MNWVKEFTIKRSKWLRGEGAHNSYLRRVLDGKECCVGQYLIACGVDEKILVGARNIASSKAPKTTEKHFVTDDESCPFKSMTDLIYVENDKTYFGLTELEKEAIREKMLTKYFAEKGITVHFED